MKKRFLAIFTAAMLLCSMLVGCGGNENSSSSTSEGNGSTSSVVKDASTTDNVSSAKTEDASVQGDKTLKLYVAGFQNLDPQIWSWGTHVDRMGIFEGLTILNSDFTTRLANAESLEHNEDYTVWTAKLREDLKWSDGTALDANDYYYSLRRVIDPQYLAGKTGAFNTNAPILNAYECQLGEVPFEEVGVKVLDDYTIEFTLSAACVDFDVRLAESWALPVPEHVIEEFGDNWTTPENIVVNGPYIPIDREEDVHLTLAPNPEYYETPALEQIDLYTGEQNQLLAYQNGDINVATITVANVDAVNEDATLSSQMKTIETSVVSFLGLLKGQNTILQDNPLIRQAISKSIDRGTIATSINKNTVTAAESLIFPKFADWTADLGIVEYNVEKSQELMEQAGYPNGEGLGTMTLLCSGTPGGDILALVDMIKQGTGIDVQIQNLEWAAFVEEREKYHDDDTWGVFVDSWNTSVANTSGAFSNYQFDPREGNLDSSGLKAFSDANGEIAGEETARATCANEAANRYEELYVKSLTESDATALDEIYQEMETLRLEDASWIPLWWTNSLLLIQPSIQGYEGNPLLLNSPPFYFKDISNG